MTRWPIALLSLSLACRSEPAPTESATTVPTNDEPAALQDPAALPPVVPPTSQDTTTSQDTATSPDTTTASEAEEQATQVEASESPAAPANQVPPAPRAPSPRPQVMIPESRREPMPVAANAHPAKQEVPDPSQETPPQESPPQESPPPPPPPTEGADDEPVDATDSQRMQNESTYEQDYLRQKERLAREQLGKWVAIVGGRLVPSDARGRVKPADSFEACVKAADEADAGALQRFVFRIGEEGDVAYSDSSSQPRTVIGSSLKSALGITATFDAREMQIEWARGNDRHSFALQQGLMQLHLSDPVGRQSMGVRLSDSSSFDGFLQLDAVTADLLDAERFEIPGRALLRTGGDPPVAALRRARVRLALPDLHLDELVPAAAWAR